MKKGYKVRSFGGRNRGNNGCAVCPYEYRIGESGYTVPRICGAEEFKAAHGVGSKGWMAYYPATGQIVITVGGAVLGTEYYGGWR